jgi:hypothetical protein
MVICKICNKNFLDINNLSKHLFIHNLSILEYSIKYENFEIPKCNCGNNLKHKNGLNFYKTCCSEICQKKCQKKTTF